MEAMPYDILSRLIIASAVVEDYLQNQKRMASDDIF